MIALLAVVAFLLGSFPSGVVLSRVFLGRDVRELGSGNIGAANVARSGGLGIGIGVALLDVLKGAVAVLLGRWAGLDAAGLAIVALAAVLGHDFSVFLGFRGGKGVATTLGVSVVLAPLAAVLAAVVWVGVLVWLDYSSMASLAALGLLPVFMGVTGQPPVYVALGGGLFLLAVVKHWGNIERLLAGEERHTLRGKDG